MTIASLPFELDIVERIKRLELDHENVVQRFETRGSEVKRIVEENTRVESQRMKKLNKDLSKQLKNMVQILDPYEISNDLEESEHLLHSFKNDEYQQKLNAAEIKIEGLMEEIDDRNRENKKLRKDIQKIEEKNEKVAKE